MLKPGYFTMPLSHVKTTDNNKDKIEKVIMRQITFAYFNDRPK